MNSLFTLTFLCLLAVGQVLSQHQPSAGASSLAGSINGGVSNAVPDPTRWIEFVDMENNWSKLGNTYSIEAWIMHSNVGTSTWQPVLARHAGMNAARQDAHFIIAVRNNNQLEVTAGCGCNSNGTNCGNGFFLLATITPSVWHHVAVTFNGDSSISATASLYVNGVSVDTAPWSAQDPQCLGRTAQWAEYAPVKVGFLDDQATNSASPANPNMFQGWRGMIDEIRFWFGVRTASQILNYRDVGLKGSEDGLFAYYQFSPSNEMLEDSAATKLITNKVGDYLHGLPQPNPMDAAIFASSTLSIGSYSVAEGQSDAADLPPLPNPIKFESWPPINTTVYSFPPSSYSIALTNLLNNPNVYAELFPSADSQSATLFIDCTNNDCSTYTNSWKDYYLEYTANVDGTITTSARHYLRIVTGCPSGVFDECGTCDGDNSQCQCVVYHGFGSERMSFILLEWSIQSLLDEVQTALTVISSTKSALETSDPNNGQLRQQISDLMTFYNTELTPYCGDIQEFNSALLSVTPKSTLTGVDFAVSSSTDGALPFVPSFTVNF